MLVLSCNLHHSLQLRTLYSQLRAHTRVLESAIWEKKSYWIQVTLYLFFRFKLWSASVDMSEDSVSNSMYMSERSTADRNFCLGYMMQEKGAFQIGKFSASAEQKTKYKRRWEYVTYCTLVYDVSNLTSVRHSVGLHTVSISLPSIWSCTFNAVPLHVELQIWHA